MVKPVQLKNTATGEVIESETIREACRLSGLGYAAVHRALKGGLLKVAGGQWLARYKTDEPWPESIDDVITHIALIGYKEGTQEQKAFPSLRSAAVFLGVDRSQIKNCMRKGKPCKGWVLKAVC